ncbi:annexin A13-like [Styela clava]
MGNMEMRPTVTPVDDFSPEADCETLRDAMSGRGTDEDEIMAILANRSTLQRQILKEKYEGEYGDELLRDLKRELRGDLEDCIMAVMDPPAVYEARQLRKAMVGPGTDDEILIEIICTKSNERIEAIKAAYAIVFERSLMEDVRDETSGDFKTLLSMMLLAERDESWEIDEDAAEADAQAIYDAGEGRWFGTDENEFTKVLAFRNYLQLRLVFLKYAVIAGNTIEEAIESETSGNLQKAYLAICSITKDVHGYYAQKLHDAMRGVGTDDDALIRFIVVRSEFDLGNVKDAYREKFDNGLWADISQECKGDYRRMLLSLIRED